MFNTQNLNGNSAHSGEEKEEEDGSTRCCKGQTSDTCEKTGYEGWRYIGKRRNKKRVVVVNSECVNSNQFKLRVVSFWLTDTDASSPTPGSSFPFPTLDLEPIP